MSEHQTTINLGNFVKKNTETVLGLDIAMRNTGFIVVKANHILDMGTIETPAFIKPKKAEEEDYFEDRVIHYLTCVKNIDLAINALIQQHSPDAIVAELPYFAQGQKAVHSIGLSWMTCFRWLFQHPNFRLIHPKTSKKHICGNKNSSKKEMANKIFSRGFMQLTGQEDHVIDAMAAAITYVEKLSKEKS